ncbi:MAG: MBL fold metallo-hydrolase [Gemmatimonadota bacterium]|nr:MBL fold metallo-hydrolase [Gemmatimonadota bacterium]
MRVTFYDVGQALASLVELPDGRFVLVDTGESPQRPGCGAVCRRDHAALLAKLERDLEEDPIALVWITHPNSDHIGGAEAVVRRHRVLAYVDNGQGQGATVARAHLALTETATPRRVVDPAARTVPLEGTDGVSLAAVVPAEWPEDCSREPNECSIGLRIDYCASSVLFTGDAEHRSTGTSRAR